LENGENDSKVTGKLS